MQKPFWEESYRIDDISTFMIEPNQTIIDRWNAFKKSGTVLDVGCGEGKNAIFLTQKGFAVDAFDISQAGIEKFKRIASRESTLHFVTKPNWKSFIRKAQENTNKGGFHIIQIFTNKLPAHPHIAPFIKGLADEGELEKLYEGWNIVESKSYIFEDQHPGVEKHLHASNIILAIK